MGRNFKSTPCLSFHSFFNHNIKEVAGSMDDFWNSNNLIRPLATSFKCKSAIDIKNVRTILGNAIDTFMVPNALSVESTVMRRVIYRVKLQLRMDKGFQLFENTNRNLNKLFSFNITKDLMYLLDKVPEKYNKDLYFPSKQMLEYVLVRLQGYSQVCSRVVESAFHAAIVMKGRLRLGHQWEIAAVCMAICSRIWQICKHLTTKCCLVYSEILPLLDKLEITGRKFLPDDYQFPNDLIEWLNYDWLLDKPEIILQLPLELPTFSLLEDDDNDVQYSTRYRINKRNKDKTIVILDSDDEEDHRGNVKFVCDFNKSYVKLNRFEVNKLNEKQVSASNRSSKAAKSDDFSTKSINYPFIQIIDSVDDDVDVQIIEPTQNHSKVLNTGAKNNPKKLNSAIAYLLGDDEVIEIDDSIAADKEYTGEADEDTGEIVKDTEETIEDPEETEYICNENEESKDVNGFQDIEISTSGKKKTKKKLDPPKKEEDMNQKITLKGYNFKMYAPEHLENFLERENKLRYTGNTGLKKKNTCISVHLTDEDWYCLSYEIKYYIAGASYTLYESRQLYISKAQEVLKKNLDVTVMTRKKGYKPENLFKERIPLNFNSRKYFINSLTTLPDLQTFLKLESELRTKARDNCFFWKSNDEAWNKLCHDIKYLILKASHKPIKNILYIKKAQQLLKILNNTYRKKKDDVTLNSDNEIKESNPVKTDPNNLFEFVKEIENYIVPNKKYKKRAKLSKYQKEQLAEIEAELEENALTEAELKEREQNKKRKLELEHMQKQNKRRKWCNDDLNNYNYLIYEQYYRDLYNYYYNYPMN